MKLFKTSDGQYINLDFMVDAVPEKHNGVYATDPKALILRFMDHLGERRNTHVSGPDAERLRLILDAESRITPPSELDQFTSMLARAGVEYANVSIPNGNTSVFITSAQWLFDPAGNLILFNHCDYTHLESRL